MLKLISSEVGYLFRFRGFKMGWMCYEPTVWVFVSYMTEYIVNLID